MERSAPALTVDTHNHYWDIARSDLYWMTPDLTLLQRSFTPPDLKPEMERVGVDRSVIVQAAKSRWDNLWWLVLAERYDYVGAVVGWVDLEDPAVGVTLDEYRRHPAFRGVRATCENEPDPEWLARPEVRRGIGEVARRGLTLDLLVRTPHLPLLPRLAEERPDLPMVVDHLAKPPLASGDAGDLDEWARGIAALAPYPHLWAKVSGLLTEAGAEPTAETLRPAVQHALATFGAGRLMWGSDWPVCLLAADYETSYRTTRAALGPLSDANRAAIYGGNAVRFYRVT